MSLKMGHELVGPEDMTIKANTGLGGGGLGGGANAPMWGVGNPLAVSMSGLEEAVSRFADTYDDIKVSDFMLRKQQELDQKYFNPETGLFNTRKGALAQGLYSEMVEDAKRITDEDAVNELSSRQRGLINSSLATMFTQWGHKVADFENEQLMNHQVEQAQNNVLAATEIVASTGNLDADALGMSYTNIQNNMIALGKMQGWDEETIVRKTREAFGDAVIKGSLAQSVSDPTKAYGALRSYRDVIPKDKYQAAISKVVGSWNENTMQHFFDIYENQGQGPAKQFLDSVSMSGRSAYRAASEESGGKPDAVNYADSGGTSVGLYQIHRGPKSDTMSEFETWLRSHGKSDVADALKGKQGKDLGETWQELVRAGKIVDSDQTSFIQEQLIDPAISRLPEELQQRINASSVYQDAIWSTAIQHGSSGAVRLMKAAWRDSGTDNRMFFESLYDLRKTQFNDQPANVRDAIVKRMEREKQRAIGELTTDDLGVSQFPKDELVLTPQKYLQAMRMMQTRDRQRGTEVNRIMRELVPNAFSEFMQTGSAESMDAVEQMLIQYDDDKAFLRFKTQRAKYEELLPFMQSNSDKSFAEQQFLAMEWLTKAVVPGPDGNAAAIDKMKEEVSRQLQRQHGEFMKDPRGYAAQIQAFRAMQSQQDPTIPPGAESQGPQNENDSASGNIFDLKENMRLQRQISGDPAFIPSVFSQERRGQLKTFFADSQVSDQDKFSMALSIAAEHGEYTEKALSELDMNGGANTAVTLAMQLGPAYENATRELFAAAMVPDAQVWTDETKKTDFMQKARDNELVEYVNMVIEHVGISNAALTQGRGLESAVAKMLALGREETLESLTNAFEYWDNQQWGISKFMGQDAHNANVVLRIPRHMQVDPMRVAYAAERFERKELEGVLPSLPPNATPQEVEQQRLRVEGMKQNMTWISTDGGRSIMAFVDGMMVARKDGAPLVLDVFDIMKKYPRPDVDTNAAMVSAHGGGYVDPIKVDPASDWRRSGYVPTPIEPGNIDVTNRVPLTLPSGQVATVRTIGIRDGQYEVVIPTIGPNGEDWSNDEAVQQYRKTGQHLGKFRTGRDANIFAEQLHESQDNLYGDK